MDDFPGWSWLKATAWVLFLVNINEMLVFNLDFSVLFVAVAVLDFLDVVSALPFEILLRKYLNVVVRDLDRARSNTGLGLRIMFIISIMSRVVCWRASGCNSTWSSGSS